MEIVFLPVVTTCLIRDEMFMQGGEEVNVCDEIAQGHMNLLIINGITLQ